MADDEKTEEPTEKKISDAREKGNVPKSQDMGGVFVLFVAILAFLMLFNYIQTHIFDTARYYFYLMKLENHLDKKMLVDIAFITMREFILIAIPLALIVAIAGVISQVSQFGFIFTTKPLVPDFSKLDPIKGMKNLVSMKKLIESIKITFKSFVTLGVGFYFFYLFVQELPTVALFTFADQMKWLADKVIVLAFVILFVLIVFAIIDLIIVRKQYFDGLKMSKQEIKDEMKNMDGDPHIKAKIRQIQMQAAQKRMMASIPDADVVVTNPTHYAVALMYDEKKHRAPIVVAKGKDNLAVQIKKIARENGVHIVENPPLARSLYKDVEVDHPISEELFLAVAELLAYVYKVNKSQKNR